MTPAGATLVNGVPQGKGEGQRDLRRSATSCRSPADASRRPARSARPASCARFSEATIELWGSERDRRGRRRGHHGLLPEADAAATTCCVAGASPTFAGVRSAKLFDKLDFLSLMLALFCGTASLPHILIRYYTVKDESAARKSTVVGIAAIGFFYVLTLYLGLGAMTSGALDVTNTNMAAPLLARSFSELLFAVISAIAFTTVLGTVSGLIIAASGAVAHDLLTNVFRMST